MLRFRGAGEIRRAIWEHGQQVPHDAATGKAKFHRICYGRRIWKVGWLVSAPCISGIGVSGGCDAAATLGLAVRPSLCADPPAGHSSDSRPSLFVDLSLGKGNVSRAFWSFTLMPAFSPDNSPSFCVFVGLQLSPIRFHGPRLLVSAGFCGIKIPILACFCAKPGEVNLCSTCSSNSLPLLKTVCQTKGHHQRLRSLLESFSCVRIADNSFEGYPLQK